MAIVFSGEAALAFAILGGMLLATGTGLLGRVAARRSRPRRSRCRCGSWARPACSRAPSLAANRWRTAALATPIVLIAMLVGTQGVLQTSAQRTPSA